MPHFPHKMLQLLRVQGSFIFQTKSEMFITVHLRGARKSQYVYVCSRYEMTVVMHKIFIAF